MQVQKMRLDALADRREVRSVAGLVFAAGPDDRGAELGDGGGELAAGVALVAQQHLAAVAAAAGEQLEADVALVDLWARRASALWGAVRGEDRVQPKPPEVAGVRRRTSRSRRRRQRRSA